MISFFSSAAIESIDIGTVYSCGRDENGVLLARRQLDRKRTQGLPASVVDVVVLGRRSGAGLASGGEKGS